MHSPHVAVDFINSLCHTGDYHGEPFTLRPWQERIIRQIFDAEGKPQYRKVFIALPRKHGKTELAAAIVLYLMLGTGKKAHRIYSASGDHKQAALIYDAAVSMIAQSETLNGCTKVYKSTKRIEVPRMDSFYEALSSEDDQKYGLRPSVIMLDELWVMPNRRLYNALKTAFGATKSPLTIMITTAGWDRESLCWEQWEYARAVRDGQIDDPGFLPILFESPDDEDWTSEDVWRKTMPALGDFCQMDFIREEFKQARQLPVYENTFKQLYLNRWTNQAERWISQEAWDACGEWFDHRELAGEQCYAGLDGAVSGDMFCYSLVFKYGEKIRILNHGFVPRDGRWRDELRNKDRYERWEREGWLTYTPGNVIDDRVVEKAIVDWNEKYPVKSLFADKARVTSLLIRLLNDHNLPVKGIAQGPVSLNEACETLEKAVIAGQIEHRNDPILSWNIANASIKRTTTGLIYPDKQSSTARIDGLSATINAFAAAIHDDENFGPSVYETRGPLWI